MRAGDALLIGLVNNMPDPALEATEVQFSTLLRAASGPRSVVLRTAWLPEVPRSDRARAYIEQRYWPIDELLEWRPDALIVTGMEPKAADLTAEPYWNRFGEILAWARGQAVTSIWSCLAAHAAVQHLDGITRQRLGHKCFGVFEHTLAAEEHPLLQGVGAPLCIPHSRWNQLQASELRDAGYRLLSWGSESGADLFVKQDPSLLVFFQGHPEYEPATLLKEYRRDIGRFLRGEQSHYPLLPLGYFSAETAAQLDRFRQHAVQQRSEAVLADFPSLDLDHSLLSTWTTPAVRIYGNWLSYIQSAKDSARGAVSEGVI